MVPLTKILWKEKFYYLQKYILHAINDERIHSQEVIGTGQDALPTAARANILNVILHISLYFYTDFAGRYDVKTARYGVNVFCPGNKIVSKFCGSGGHADCTYNGSHYHTVIYCQSEK